MVEPHMTRRAAGPWGLSLFNTSGASMMQGPVAIILAAGHGKRMKSEKAKVLHEVCGRPMVRYVVEAVRGAGAGTIVVVVGHGGDQVRAELADEPDVFFAE